jgi:hypothetical protein
MVVTGELIRLMNFIDDISATLRRIQANMPLMNDEERKRLADHIRKVQPAIEQVVQTLEKGSK